MSAFGPNKVALTILAGLALIGFVLAAVVAIKDGPFDWYRFTSLVGVITLGCAGRWFLSAATNLTHTAAPELRCDRVSLFTRCGNSHVFILQRANQFIICRHIPIPSTNTTKWLFHGGEQQVHGACAIPGSWS